MSAPILPRALRALAAAACVGAIVACDADRAVVSEPVVPDIVNGRFAPDGRNLPNGTAYWVNWNEDDDPSEDEVLVEMAGLESLSTGAYHVWLARVVDDAIVSTTPATGLLIVYGADTTFNQLGDIETVDEYDEVLSGAANAFPNGGANRRLELYVPQASVGDYNAVVVTVEEGAPTTATLTGPRPLWATGLDALREAALENESLFESTPLAFGTVDPARVSRSYTFAPVGRGLANFFSATQMAVADSALARPPVGYYYATSLIARNLARVPIDTLVIGEQTAPAPRRSVSLRDADVQAVDPVVQATSILAAANLFRATGGTPFVGFNEVTVHLENKRGIDLVSPSQVLVAPVPAGTSAP